LPSPFASCARCWERPAWHKPRKTIHVRRRLRRISPDCTDSYANEDENLFSMPGGAYKGATLRAYDPKSGQWAIWWLDGRTFRLVQHHSVFGTLGAGLFTGWR
jgi:hypothetical protein